MKNKKWILPVSALSIVIVLFVALLAALSAISAKAQGSRAVAFEAQYVRTEAKNQVYTCPANICPFISVINSKDELTAYYRFYRYRFDLEHHGKTTGFLDACDKYDADFFEKNFLVLAVLEEGSGSTRHNVEAVTVDRNGNMNVNIISSSPESGTCDMAQWHIIVAVEKGNTAVKAEDIVLNYNNEQIKMDDGHIHKLSSEPQTVQTVREPVIGDSCGIYEVTIYFENDKSYDFSREDTSALFDIFASLKYDKNKLCKCLPECWVGGEFGRGFGISLSDGYVRCDDSQADLTEEQLEKLKEIVLWAKEQAENDPTNKGNHTHQLASEPQTVSDPISGYCGNMQTTVYFDMFEKYTFMGGNSVALTDILENLDYDKNKLCRCLSEYCADTELTVGYRISLSDGFVRCYKGQADLTEEQLEKVKEIIMWAWEQAENEE